MAWTLVRLFFISMAIYNLSKSLDISASSDKKLEYGVSFSSDPSRIQIQSFDFRAFVNGLPLRTRKEILLRGIKLLEELHDESEKDEVRNSEDEFPDSSFPASSATTTMLRQLVKEHQKVHRNLLMVAKKNVNVLFPFICSPPFRWKRLDPDHYPRHVQSVQCDDSDCPNFLYCRPREYRVRVLRKIGHNESIADTDVAAMPAALQTEIPIPERYVDENEPNTVRFKFTEITVNITCECSGVPI